MADNPTLKAHDPVPGLHFHGFKIEVIKGNAQDVGKTVTHESIDEFTIGTSPERNDLVLTDSSVSRSHLRIKFLTKRQDYRTSTPTPRGGSLGEFVFEDLNSTNKTWSGPWRIDAGATTSSAILTLGNTVIRFVPLLDKALVEDVSQKTTFGEGDCAIVGKSLLMRRLFYKLEKASPTEFGILLEGETGTGKGYLARAIHQNSKRSNGPFVVCDCGALPPNLIESELFGYAKGAFTGADRDHAGLFEKADGGTIFLDEIGELPLELQPKLLRAVEEKKVRRIGGAGTHRTVDIRVVSATNRDLRVLVNQQQFREDLYYRLAVIPLRVPPLRERGHDDILAWINRLSNRLSLPPPPPAVAETLARRPWPGNLRQLVNALTLYRTTGQINPGEYPPGEYPHGQINPGEYPPGEHPPQSLPAAPQAAPQEFPQEFPPVAGAAEMDANRPLDRAFATAAPNRKMVSYAENTDHATREYLRRLLQHTAGNVTEAAKIAGVSRMTVYRWKEKYGLS
jgi:DNA-binding NtrC family response regulator